MSDEKAEGDLRDSDAVEFTEDGEPVFERAVTQKSDTDTVDHDGLYQAMETENDS